MKVQERLSFPLTEEQQAIWTEYKIDPRSTNYNAYSISRIDGPLDIDKFLKIENTVSDYFQTSRVKFIETDGRVMQYCTPIKKRTKNLIELSAFEPLDPLHIIRELTQRPFDLTRELSCQNLLLKVNDRLFYYLVFQHHICSDGSSAEIYLTALSIAYNEGIISMRNKFPQKTMETCVRDIKRLEENAKNMDAYAYWRERLDGANFTFDFQNLNVDNRSSGQDALTFDLGNSLYAKIKKYSRQNRTTPFLLIGGVINILLYKYWHQEDITIGYSVNGRPKGYQLQLGNFIKILPLRTKLDCNDTLNSIVKQITVNRKKDSVYQALSFLTLTNIYREVNSIHRSKLNISYGQTRLILDNLKLRGVSTQSIHVYPGGMKTDLDFIYDPVTENLRFQLRYNTSIFSGDFIQHLPDNLTYLTGMLLENPATKLSHLNVVCDAEWSQI